MRVLHVITRLIVGGAQENTIATVLGLRARHGHDVRLLSGPTTGPEGSLEGAFNHAPELLVRVPDLIRSISPWHDARAFLWLSRYFKEARPDIVHTHSGKAGFLGRLAARRARVPVIIHTIHGPSFGPFQGALANTAFLAAERLAARVTTRFISVAEAMTRQYLAAGVGTTEQFTVIRSGFNLAPFLSAAADDSALRARLEISSDDFVITQIARLAPLKGHDDLLDAAPEILRRCPRALFLLVGDGPDAARLRARATDVALRGRVRFAGLVPPGEIPALLGITHALVHLSHREGLARALPQALAAGRPVVAWDCDGAGEVCRNGETGFLLSPRDHAGLVESLVQLAASPALRARLGERGRAEVRARFGEERMVDAIHALYGRGAA